MDFNFKGFYDEIIFDVDRSILKSYTGKQGDTKSRGLYVTVTQKNAVIDDLTGLSMRLFYEKPDKTRGFIDGVVDGNKFRIDYTNQMYAVPGVVKAELRLTGPDGEIITAKTFKILVDSSIADGSIVSKNERGILDRAFELAEDIIPRLELLDVELLEDVQAEILGARHSGTKDATYDSLGQRLDAFEQDLLDHKAEYTSNRQQDQLKIAKVEKELNDYKATMQQVNINQEPKQKASGHGIVSLPPNAAEGQVSVTVKGNTETDEEGNTKSTIGAVRIKSVGKNLFDKNRALKGYILNFTDGVQQPYSTPSFCSDFIRVDSNEQYYVTGFLGKGYAFIAFYDSNKNFTRRTSASIRYNILISDIQDHEKYIRITVYDTANGPATWQDIDDVLNNLQVERGNVATPYEPYRESNVYITAKNEAGSILELRSLPNGIKDEIRVSEGKLIKRVSDVVDLSKIEWVEYVDGHTANYYAVSYQSPIVWSSPCYLNYNGSRFGVTTEFNQVDNLAYYYAGTTTIRIKIPKTAYAGLWTLSETKTWLQNNQITLIYQLAEPIEIPIQVSGTLTSYPNGTIYIERILPDAGVYTDKITILHQDAPIKRLDKLSKVDFMTGVETELDVSEAVIAEDKLSFTHPDLSEGDIVFFEYEYDLESTQGETEIEYYDSRYVIKDSVTDKFYKWHIIVADGVPSIELVEV